MENEKKRNYALPLVTLTTLFFMWGFITSMNDILIPYLKEVFELDYFRANLVQSAFFVPYFIMSLIYFIISILWGDPISKIGYKNMIISGLIISAISCFLFYNEASSKEQAFEMFLLALCLLGAGFSFLQIAANPLIAILGSPKTASSRLNLSQGFNSLGTTLAPIIGGFFVFNYFAKNASGASAVQIPYLVLASVLLLLAGIIFFSYIPNVEDETSGGLGGNKTGVLKHPHLVFGMIGIFCYVGAEVAIGSNLISFMEKSQGMTKEAASTFLSFYWGGAMIGRFMGAISMSQMATMKKRLLMGVSAVLTFLFVVVAIQMSAEIRGGEQVPLDKVLYYIGFLVLNYIVFIAAKSVPSRMLGLFAVVNMALITIMLLTDGDISLWMILAVGLFNSIMFSNVFTLAIDGLGKYTSQGSSLLVMMILGGAVVPPIQGMVADCIGVHAAFVVPLFCYAYLVWYGFVGSRMRKPLTEKN